MSGAVEAIVAHETPHGDIQVVTRCAQILRLFSATRRSLRIAEVAEALALRRTTAHRYLTSMANADVLERGGDGSFVLGPLILQLGVAALRGVRVLEVAGPFMQRLADETSETVVLAVWGGLGPVVGLVQESSTRLVHISVRVGSPLPLEAAQSLVFLAFLANRSVERRLLTQLTDVHRREIQQQVIATRRNGFASNAAVFQGIRALAVPVFDGQGEICATLAVIGSVMTVPADPSNLLAALMRMTEQLSRELGCTQAMPFKMPVLISESVS
ncbi:MAG: IclR family transcriptional regulator [Acidimicrobiales bacterium]